MSQRTRAGLLALCLLAVLWGAAAFVPLPYVTYYPGPTVDILASRDGEETVQVDAAAALDRLARRAGHRAGARLAPSDAVSADGAGPSRA